MLLPKFSFSLPVYNEERQIKKCLTSIINQNYPKENIEILLIDGGSSDRTKEIASKFECVKIFNNSKKLADFGAKISIKKATGDFFVIFAADNELAGDDWLISVANLFLKHKDISAIWGRMVSSVEDAPINKYYEFIQNDPMSFFINKNMNYYFKMANTDCINDHTFYIFNFDKTRPLIWGANGLVYKTEKVRDIISREEFTADNDVFQIMVEQYNVKLAYSKDLNIRHHHISNLFQWVKKWRRNYIEHYLKQRRTRNLRWVCAENFIRKLFFWIMYSLIPLFSINHSIFLAIRNRNIYWLYHPLANFAQVLTYSVATCFNKEGWYLIRGKFSLMFGNKIKIFR